MNCRSIVCNKAQFPRAVSIYAPQIANDEGSGARFDSEHHKRAGCDYERIVFKNLWRPPSAAGFLSIQNQFPAVLRPVGW